MIVISKDQPDAPPAGPPPRDARAQALVAALGSRAIVLIGMMGSGKTSVGRRLAARLGLPFHDADAEIEAAAGMTIPEIFARHGEAHFRDGERKVMARLLQFGPQVLATGGGAFMNEATRAAIAAHGVSVWLKAEFDVLMRRVRKRATRPLLQTPDPEGTLRGLIAARYPIYQLADVCVVSQDGPHEAAVEETLRAIETYVAAPKQAPQTGEDMHTTNTVPRQDSVEKVEVGLGARGYDILIGPGLIARAGAEIALRAPGAACAIVTDENLARLHAPALEASLDAAGVRHARITLAPGETSKSFANFERVCDEIIAAKMERGDLVVALGGGVMGDLAGFAASAVRRGMRFVQVPTTLLSQVDSSVGGKTGINSRHGKNLIGAFHQPSLVLADTGALATLSPREFRAGYAEVVKYGLIDDRAFFEWLEANWRAVFAGGPERARAIATSCRAKAAVVARDEFETGDRALLNLGHTFGHALERLTHYDSARLVHGEGVAIGMALAFRFSVARGQCSGQDAARVAAHLSAVGLPTRIQDIAGSVGTPDQIVEAMYQDKKVQRGALTFILARGIGESFIAKGVGAEDVRAFLAKEFTGR
jgi:shikimate kinase/3-dehydroquinate synthase